MGLQTRRIRYNRGEWELTEDGEGYGETMPYARNSHVGYQILWWPEIEKILAED